MFKQPTHFRVVIWFSIFFFNFHFQTNVGNVVTTCGATHTRLTWKGFISPARKHERFQLTAESQEEDFRKRLTNLYRLYWRRSFFFENVIVFQINYLMSLWHCLWRLTFWDMKPCWVEISHRNFGECFCFHL